MILEGTIAVAIIGATLAPTVSAPREVIPEEVVRLIPPVTIIAPEVEEEVEEWGEVEREVRLNLDALGGFHWESGGVAVVEDYADSGEERERVSRFVEWLRESGATATCSGECLEVGNLQIRFEN